MRFLFYTPIFSIEPRFSFENPNYRLFFGVIVCQYHKMRISEFLRPVLWTEKGLSLHTNQQSNNFVSLFAMQ
jgi:hypothetical protein